MTATATLQAFHNDPAIKQKFIDRVKEHARLDQIVQGIGFDSSTGKGCCIGCMFDKYDHASGAEEIEVPIGLLFIADNIHERLTPAKARKWPLRFSSAIKLGSDTTLVPHKMIVWYLLDPENGAIRFAKKWPDIAAVIEQIGSLYQRVIDGGTVTAAEWNEAAALAALAARADLAALAALAARADLAADKLVEFLEAA